jgi:uncharacterized FAD-dependent dehydrogenase
MNDSKILIRVEQLSLTIEQSEHLLTPQVAKILGIKPERIRNITIAKRAIDSRKKRQMIYFIYSVDVEIENAAEYLKQLEHLPKHLQKNITLHRVRQQEYAQYDIPKISEAKLKHRPIVVGTGPSGLFCALLLAKAGCNPLVIERGKNVEERIKDIQQFQSGGKLNVNSNVQFGEGGAGTFSDGKLNTLINNPLIKHVFDEFIAAGAPAEITWDATPHIGTDKLRDIVKNMRENIIRLGGEVRFETTLTDIKINDGKVVAAILNEKEEVPTHDLIIAIGHSARDTYEMLLRNKIEIVQKDFAIGVRIEHTAEMINKSQYDKFHNHPCLCTGRYKLVSHSETNRSVYTFCMCPGGYVVAATSEDKQVVTNGMSEYAQDGKNSNSALLVPVTTNDFGSDHPLAGVEFQRKIERLAYTAGGENFYAPAQLVGDFLAGRPSTQIKSITPTYLPGVKPTSLSECLPKYVIESLREALPQLDQKINGFACPDAVLTGVETRTTAPIRMVRNENLESNILGIYPAGEGAGYAGGIVSSAVDGLRVGEAILKKYC